MPAPDEKYRALAKSGRASIWDEALRLYPLKNGVVDQSRPLHSCTGSVRQGNEKEANASGGGAQAWSTRIAAGEAEAYITRSTYTGPQIKEGDKLRRMDRAGQPFYEIASVNDRDAGDIILKLTEA
ncbi:hypothetical protein SAMN06297251_102132 [Fulvimarina manganoxydans]|uniref:Uncharacterized protein n=1 Tax=Fulvimarina manganoxydans TaxID=937218 RepID=A0A1W1Z3P9_9HYPH|nr:hypothetical protein [Fulvimarina manganoxydans]SMC43013.1 hypothetical protein SAMN06297251_102132 [Fulvimarina manganoxydans]